MPRFLERDECERERAVRAVSVGRRAQCAAVLALPEDSRRRAFIRRQPKGPQVARLSGISMLHIPILRWGVPYRSVNQVVTPHFRTREPFVSMSQANSASFAATCCARPRRGPRCRRFRSRELVAMAGTRRRAFPERHAAARSGERHEAIAAALRRAGLGHHRHAVQQRAPQHAESARRARQGRRGARRADARPRPVGARRRLRHRATGRC